MIAKGPRMRRFPTALSTALVVTAALAGPAAAQVISGGPTGSGGQAPGTIAWAFSVPVTVSPANVSAGFQQAFGITVTCAVGSGLSYDPSIGQVAGNVTAKATSALVPAKAYTYKVGVLASVAAFEALTSPMYVCFSTLSHNPTSASNPLPPAANPLPASTVVTGTLPGPTGS